MKSDVIIIGGGASGIICALRLRQLSNNLKITILEKQNRIGKKILVTGNGRCNISNNAVNSHHYNQKDFMEHVLAHFTFSDSENFFKDLGIFFRVDDVGRAYPYSESAKSFLDLLLYHLDRGSIDVQTSQEVVDVQKVADGYLVYTDNNKYQARYVVFATGGQAYINFNNRSYDVLKSLNHHIVPLRPGLVPLKVLENTKALNGIRVKSKASLIQNGQLIHSSEGEIQFRDDGLSGILSLELSSFYSRLNNKQDVIVSLDLMEDYSIEEIKKFLFQKLNNEFDEENLLTGIFNKMLAIELIKRTKEEKGDFVSSLVQKIKDFRFTIIDTYPFNSAQVTLGGVLIDEVDYSFESKLHQNLYIIGEALDIDGNTGGFNLHFAWLSGLLCANNIYINLKNN